MDYSSRFSTRSHGLTPSPIRKLVPIMRLPGMISLGGGYPNADTFAFERLDVRFRSGKTFAIEGPRVDLACQYGPTDAQPDLKPLIQAWHQSKDGVALESDQVQVLNGAQEGLHIMAYLFLDETDCVAVSEPAYPGALGAFNAFCRNFIAVPLDKNGMITAELERILEQRRANGQPMPKFIYDVPNGHNPGGVALSVERRKHLLAIAARFDLLILEDDPYQLLLIEDQPPLPTLQSMDTEHRVIRLDSFSKIFAPGLRIGYASGPSAIIQKFNLYKQGSNLHTSSMVQSILAGYMEQHPPEVFRELIRANCRLYRRNRDAMVSAAREFLPQDVRFNIPREGMFLWFELPLNCDAERMMETDGREIGVLLVPGSAFSTTGGLKNCMRASYSMMTSEQIREGMKRFGLMIEREQARN